MSPLLEVQNLTKSFPVAGSRKVLRAVNGVDFAIDRGETLALVGESGSGKTTVGRCVVGLIEPTEGQVWFDGRPMARGRSIRSADLRGRLQLVFQEPAESLNPRMRVGEILGEPLIYLGLPRADRERRVEEVAARLGLAGGTLAHFPAELSAGQQQRVAIGRAIITKPELIVLDEPTSALDPTARAEIVDLLMRLQRELGTAYLFISHDLSTVRFVSHRVAVLYLGAIVEEARSEALFARPLHPYSVGLLASVLLPDPRLQRSTMVVLEGEIPSPIDLLPGCSLAGRCPFADDLCRKTRPPAIAAGAGHSVSCFHHEKVAALDRSVDHFARFQEESNKLLSVGAR
jgi:oligopeptide/dipeptide ABC transporter ATP-binding protein